jgi:hypothetical protein
MSLPDCFDDGFSDLKESFTDVAGRTTGDMRDLILLSANVLAPRSGVGAVERMAQAYDDLMDELEEKSLTDPRAAEAMDDLGAALSKSMARAMVM